MIVKWINPFTNEEDVLNIERPIVDYKYWLNYGNVNPIDQLKVILATIDCTREYDYGRPMMTSFLSYKLFMSDYYYQLLHIDNPIIYNIYIDKLINRHIKNILFEYNNPYIDKRKTNNKNKTKRKKNTINKYIKRVSYNLITGNKVYVYTNPKTNDVIESDNPNLEDKLNKIKFKEKKTKSSKVPLSAMTFNFKNKNNRG